MSNYRYFQSEYILFQTNADMTMYRRIDREYRGDSEKWYDLGSDSKKFLLRAYLEITEAEAFTEML